jgi:hypothetical protein
MPADRSTGAFLDYPVLTPEAEEPMRAACAAMFGPGDDRDDVREGRRHPWRIALRVVRRAMAMRAGRASVLRYLDALRAWVVSQYPAERGLTLVELSVSEQRAQGEADPFQCYGVDRLTLGQLYAFRERQAAHVAEGEALLREVDVEIARRSERRAA